MLRPFEVGQVSAPVDSTKLRTWHRGAQQVGLGERNDSVLASPEYKCGSPELSDSAVGVEMIAQHSAARG